MKKQKQKQTHELYQFSDHCHLFNIFSGGSGKGLELLRKIVDSIQNDNYSDPGNKTGVPLFLVPIIMRVFHTYPSCLEEGGA